MLTTPASLPDGTEIPTPSLRKDVFSATKPSASTVGQAPQQRVPRTPVDSAWPSAAGQSPRHRRDPFRLVRWTVPRNTHRPPGPGCASHPGAGFPRATCLRLYPPVPLEAQRIKTETFPRNRRYVGIFPGFVAAPRGWQSQVLKCLPAALPQFAQHLRRVVGLGSECIRVVRVGFGCGCTVAVVVIGYSQSSALAEPLWWSGSAQLWRYHGDKPIGPAAGSSPRYIAADCSRKSSREDPGLHGTAYLIRVPGLR